MEAEAQEVHFSRNYVISAKALDKQDEQRKIAIESCRGQTNLPCSQTSQLHPNKLLSVLERVFGRLMGSFY